MQVFGRANGGYDIAFERRIYSTFTKVTVAANAVIGKQMLARRPRADMPGFQPCEVDCRREEKYAARRSVEARNREAIRAGMKVYD